ncbi:MAG: DUF4838 domain-containing protein [Planctomycetota bacterium]
MVAKRILTVVLLVFWAIGLVACAEEGMAIVVGNKPGSVEQFAAEELQNYLEKITGQKVPIQAERTNGATNLIITGTDGVGDEGFILRAEGNDLLLAGGGPRGRLYAVYEFIEKHLGVRWFGSDASDEVIPKRSADEIIAIVKKGINDKQVPSFYFREVSINLGGPTSMSTLGKLRFNAVMTGYALSDTWRQTTLPELRKRGIDLVIGGHDTYRRFLPPEKHFVEHPDWSILRKGQRVGTDTLDGGATFCTTNKEALAIFLDNLAAHVKQMPEAKYIYPWPSDGARWCECETCNPISVGDRLLALDIAIAEAVKKVRPDMIVIHFAYGSHMEIPQDLRPPREMAISLSTWGRNFAYAMEEEGTDKKFRDALAGWSRICEETGCPLYVHSKLMRLFGNGFVLMPYAVAPRDMKFRKKMGVDGFDFHRGNYGWWTKGLNDSVIAKLAWNCEADVNAIIDDYFVAYWAPVGEDVRRIFLSVEKALPDRRYWAGHTNPNLFHTNIEGNDPRYIPKILRADTSFKKEYLDEIEKYNDNSLSVLGDSLDAIRRLRAEAKDPVLSKRLAKLDTTFEYVILQREAIRGFLALRKDATPMAASASESLRKLDEQEAKITELEALEKKIEAVCTKENRAAGVLWDNGQTRLDALKGWRDAIPQRKALFDADAKIEKDIVWQIGTPYATFVGDMGGGAGHPAHVKYRIPDDWTLGRSASDFPQRHNEPGKKCACRYDIIFKADAGKYLLTVAHGTSAKPETVHVLLDGAEVGKYTTQNKERSVRADFPLSIKEAGEHTITLTEPEEEGGGYELDAIRLVRVQE